MLFFSWLNIYFLNVSIYKEFLFVGQDFFTVLFSNKFRELLNKSIHIVSFDRFFSKIIV